MAARPAVKLSMGCLMASNGFALSLMSFLTAGKLFLNINLLRSRVPKRLETALNLEPFTFSNKIAGPPISYTRR